MPRQDSISVTIPGELGKELDGLALKIQSEIGGHWSRPALIKFLLSYYKNNGIMPVLNKEQNNEVAKATDQ